MSETYTYNEIEQIAAVIRTKATRLPKVGLILGSGLGSLAAAVEQPTNIPYSNLPAFPVATVEGHVSVAAHPEEFAPIPIERHVRVHDKRTNDVIIAKARHQGAGGCDVDPIEHRAIRLVAVLPDVTVGIRAAHGSQHGCCKQGGKKEGSGSRHGLLVMGLAKIGLERLGTAR